MGDTVMEDMGLYLLGGLQSFRVEEAGIGGIGAGVAAGDCSDFFDNWLLMFGAIVYLEI